MNFFKNKNFINTQDFSREELDHLINLAIEMKKRKVKFRKKLDRKILAMLFFNPSLRTRISFEVGMEKLGGHAVNLTIGQGMWDIEYHEGVVMDQDKPEHIKEAARVLSRYCDAIAVRSFPKLIDWQEDKKDLVINGFAKYSTVPVINMESSLYHPCQALADMMTIKEQFKNPLGKKFVLCWVYHPKPLSVAVPNSAVLITSQFGMDVKIATPKDYDLPKEILDVVKKNCEINNRNFELVNDVNKAFEGADIIYAKSWGSINYYGKWEAEKLIRNNLKNWIVDRKKMSLTNDAKFMHCLPVRRGVEVTDEIIDSENSIVYIQAENRLYTQNALLVSIFGNLS